MEVVRRVKESLRKEKRNIVALLLLVFYGYICLNDIDLFQEADASLGAYILAVFTNHYYICYGLITYCLYWMIKDIKSVSDHEKIRHGSYGKYYFIRLLTVFVKITIYVVAHLIVALSVGLGKFRMGIDLKVNTMSEDKFSGTLVSVIELCDEKISNSILAIIVSSIFLIMGMFLMYVLIFYSYELKGNNLAIGMAIIIVMSAIIGMRFDMGEVEATIFFDNYMVFHHVLIYKYWIIYAIINMSVVIMLTLLLHIITVSVKSGKGVIGSITSKEYTEELMVNKKVIYIFIAVSMALYLYKVFNGMKNSAMDFELFVNTGFSYNNIDIMDVINYIVYFMCPIFILGVYLENEKQDKYIIAKVRYKKRINWDAIVIFNCYKLMLIYSAFMMLAQALIMIVLVPITKTSSAQLYTFFKSEYGISGICIILYTFISVIIKIVELIILFEIMYIAIKLMKNTIAGFLVPFIGYIVSLIIGANSNFNPFGAGALYNLAEKSKTDVLITLVSSIMWMIVLIIVRKIVSRKYNSNREYA